MLVHIQILRFIAAVSVIAFHALGVAPDGHKVAESPISFVLSYGGRGVDLFFVISGFIIFYATDGRGLTPAEFLRRRVERIAASAVADVRVLERKLSQHRVPHAVRRRLHVHGFDVDRAHDAASIPLGHRIGSL